MSQVNVNPPGGPYYRDDAGAAAAGVSMLAVLAWGAFAGHWFGPIGSNSNTTTVTTTSAPARAPSTTGPTVSTAPVSGR
jgi:hypothetical protein